MQHNNINQKNKSHILRTTEQAKRKSRHRLIGSIFLLLIALIILLNITSRTKPIPINPQKIVINNTNADQPKIISSEPVKSTTLASQVVSSMPIASQKPEAGKVVTSITPHNNNNLESIPKPDSSQSNANNNQLTQSDINSDDMNSDPTPNGSNRPKVQINEDNSPQNINITFKLSPRIITEKQPNKLTPEQILNGDKIDNTSKYYVQLIALSDKNKILHIQSSLKQKGYKTFLQSIKATNGSTMYRLRAGPYNSEDLAKSALSKLNNYQNLN